MLIRALLARETWISLVPHMSAADLALGSNVTLLSLGICTEAFDIA